MLEEQAKQMYKMLEEVSARLALADEWKDTQAETHYLKGEVDDVIELIKGNGICRDESGMDPDSVHKYIFDKVRGAK